MIFSDEFFESIANKEGNIRYFKRDHTYNKVDTFHDSEQVCFYDDILNRKFSFSFHIFDDKIKVLFVLDIGSGFYNESSWIRSVQIANVLFPEVESYFLKHPKYRIKLAMKQFEIVFPDQNFFSIENKKISAKEKIFRDVIRTDQFIVHVIFSLVVFFLSFIGFYFMIKSPTNVLCFIGISILIFAQVIPFSLMFWMIKSIWNIYRDCRKANSLLKKMTN